MARSLGDAFVTIYAKDDQLKGAIDDAQTRFRALAADMAKKRQIGGSTAELQRDLDRASLKVARLGDKMDHLDVGDVRGFAKLQAQLSAAIFETDRLNSKMNNVGNSSGISKLTSQLGTLQKKVTDSDFFKPSLGGSIFALLPTLIPAATAASGAIGLVGASFGAAGVAAGGFGLLAKSVLTSASSDSQKLAALQAAGTKQSTTLSSSQALALASLQQRLGEATTKAQKTSLEQQISNLKDAQGRQTAAMKAAQAQQITTLEKGWSDSYKQVVTLTGQISGQFKTLGQSVASPVLVPWLGVVESAMKDLKPLVQPVADEFEAWGKAVDQYFKSKTGSTEIKSMATALGQFASLQLADIVQFLRDMGTVVHNLGKDLGADNVNFGSFGDHLDAWGNAFAKWSKSKQARDDVSKFLKFMHDDGGLIVSTVKQLGQLVPGIFSGASAVGTAELNAINDLLGAINELPPSWAKPLTEAAGAILILSKTGLLKVGVTIVGTAAKLISGATMTLGGGAAAAEIRAAFASGGAAAAAEIRAAMAGGGAVGGAAGAGASAGEGAGAGTAAGIVGRLGLSSASALAAYAAGGALIAGGIALRAKQDLQGGFQAIGQDVPKWLSIGGPLQIAAEGWATVIDDHFKTPVKNMFDDLGRSIANQWTTTKKDTSDSFSAMGSVAGRYGGPLGQPFKDAQATASQQFDKMSDKAQVTMAKIQASIDATHGKTIDVGVAVSGQGQITAKVEAGQIAKQERLLLYAAGGYVSGGVSGRDSVPIMAMPGEVVVPTQMVKGGAVDHLRGKLPGFAAGGVVDKISGTAVPWVANQGRSFMRGADSDFMSGVNAVFASVANSTLSALQAQQAAKDRALSGVGGLGRAGLRQIENWWTGAGGPGGGTAHVAAAITGAESGFNPRAVQAGQPYATTGWGLWQITPGNSEPQAGINQQLLTGPSNAIAAVAKYRQAGGSFSPWTTYEDGAYRQFLAKGGKVEPLGKQISQALGVVRNHPGEPQKYNQLEIQLGSWANRVSQDKQLRRTGVHNTGLDADERHVKALRKAIAPLSGERKTVRDVRGHLRTDEESLRKSISDATARGWGGVADRLTNRLHRDLAAGKQMGSWLDQIAPKYTQKDQRQDTRWVDSVISGDLKKLGLPAASYDSGGYLPTGLSLAYNGLGRPEKVGGPMEIKLTVDTKGGSRGTDLDRAIVAIIQRHVYVAGAGDAQVALGRVN